VHRQLKAVVVAAEQYMVVESSLDLAGRRLAAGVVELQHTLAAVASRKRNLAGGRLVAVGRTQLLELYSFL
jgi:hypothetical protein